MGEGKEINDIHPISAGGQNGRKAELSYGSGIKDIKKDADLIKRFREGWLLTLGKGPVLKNEFAPNPRKFNVGSKTPGGAAGGISAGNGGTPVPVQQLIFYDANIISKPGTGTNQTPTQGQTPTSTQTQKQKTTPIQIPKIVPVEQPTITPVVTPAITQIVPPYVPPYIPQVIEPIPDIATDFDIVLNTYPPYIPQQKKKAAAFKPPKNENGFRKSTRAILNSDRLIHNNLPTLESYIG